MTFYRDFSDDGCYSQLGYDDFYDFGGLNGFRFGSPFGFYRDQFQYGPYGYRSFGNLYGNRGFLGYRGYYGDLYGFGYRYPFSSRFGGRFY